MSACPATRSPTPSSPATRTHVLMTAGKFVTEDLGLKLENLDVAMLGSAKLLRDTGEHPVVLRERVTSPAGTTAAALRQLEEHKVRAAFLVAIEAARDRSRALAAGQD